MSTKKIHVTTENLFPIIKKFLYSDQDIFIRELVSNAVDACTKLQVLGNKGVASTEDPFRVHVSVDKDAKTITIEDNGIGMTAEEVEQYINEVAFSGAKDFMSKYDEKAEETGIIGNFGLGFYSAFMVASKVELFTKSYQEGTDGVFWSCEGTPEIVMEANDKSSRGTKIVLHIASDSEDFLEDSKISELLNKYCKFLPIEIQFGTTKRTEGEGDDAVEVEEDNIINNPNPAWVKKPADLEDADYNAFYKELYPMQFEDPLFQIHLNVDFPFHLNGILYFPKIKAGMDLQKNKIQLYSRQVFVTDSVEGIVPDFLQFLHGVIDSPDIPLNVSRSYLQSDGNVKKISAHITKKVASKLDEMYRKDADGFKAKWEDIKMIVEYGSITDDKFFDKAQKFFLYPTTDGELSTFDAMKERIKPIQTDKDSKTIILYASSAEGDHSAIEECKAKGYEVLLLDSPLTPHFIQKMEGKDSDIRFAKVDSDAVDQLIKQTDESTLILTEEETKHVKTWVEETVNDSSFAVQIEGMDSAQTPFVLTQSEFMRRMKEMQATGGGGMTMFGDMPDSYNLVINGNHPFITSLKDMSEDQRSAAIKEAFLLAKLSKNLLKGKELTDFVQGRFKTLVETK